MARADLPGEDAVWARPTPAFLASALSSVVDDLQRAATSAAPVRVRPGWAQTQAMVADLIESACKGVLSRG